MLIIINKAIESILETARKNKDRNPGEILAPYHRVLASNLLRQKKRKNPEEKHLAIYSLDEEVQMLPKFLSINNLYYIKEIVEKFNF